VGGLSWGGGLALELYRRHPQLPRSLVLASAYAGWAGSLPPEVVAERLRQVMREAELPPAQWVPGYLDGLFTDAAPAQVAQEALAIMLEARPGGMRPMVQGFAEADLREVPPRIQVPTLRVLFTCPSPRRV
jgi:pimeloyl-ACP methyl ester carboxylesterase